MWYTQDKNMKYILPPLLSEDFFSVTLALLHIVLKVQ